MPELPEVETIARYLDAEISGRTIKAFELFWPRTLSGAALGEAQRRLCGRRIESVKRRGKFVTMRLKGKGSETALAIHLRMSGRLDIETAAAKPRKHDRAVFVLDDGRSVCFNDTRKFGRIFVASRLEEITGRLGPEPLLMRTAEFAAELKSRSGRIKPLLLNQTFIAGIGNIYADEALWRARIHPLRGSRRISTESAALLHRAIRRTLQQAIKHHGTDFGDGVIQWGAYRTRVYGREGRPCPRCRAPIRRIVVGQRSTHFCGKCQK